MAEKKYINHKKFNSKLNYIIRAYGLSGVISEKIKKAIKESEAADVVEVVRCKDCKYYLRDLDYCKKHNKGYCKFDGTIKTRNHFCGYGERKEAPNDK